ncbi:MAG: hypothetical protein Q4C53_09010, partial [Clostridia bacterium]|nr:hypothetical protein [Clostridia bacterium]
MKRIISLMLAVMMVLSLVPAPAFADEETAETPVVAAEPEQKPDPTPKPTEAPTPKPTEAPAPE